MKRVVRFSLLLALCFFSYLNAQQKQLTVEDIYKSSKYKLNFLSGIRWLPDGTGFLFVKKQDGQKQLFVHRVNDGSETLWLDLQIVIDPLTQEPIQMFDYALDKAAQKILFKVDAKRVWRRYDEARFLVYDLQTKTIQAVFTDSVRVRHAKLSPDGRWVGFVFENNLFVQNLSNGQIEQITHDGSKTIINGQFDWVYEEEFGQSDGWRWAPDSRKIAFWRVDQSPEPTFSWTEFEGKYGAVRTIHYPKAGDPNAQVQIGVYDLQSQNTTWMDTQLQTDFYIPRIQWTHDPQKLSIQRLNRLQNKLELLLGDVKNGKCKVLLVEQDSCWVDVRDDLTFFKKKPYFLWTSERDGFRHLYLYDLNGKFIRQLTHGDWEVTAVLGVNEKQNKIFFTANKGNVTQNHVFSVDLKGKHLQQLDQEPGTHFVRFSPDWQYFIDQYSSLQTPPVQVLKKASGQTVRSLVTNSLEQFSDVQLALPQLLTFTTSDGVELNAMMTKPVDFDPQKRYPVLIYGYGGPGSQLVRDVWQRRVLWHTLLTQKGYIVFTVDNRGTGGRGKAFKNLAYGNIGKYALKDHIEAVKYLRRLPFVDGSRIGIWGWSGGGYLTLLCMTKGADFFKTGIAVAPVVDFRLYDTIWTERYMGLPQQNTTGYDSTSVLSYVSRYKGPLLIVHGSSDDNVHMQNTMQFIKRLQEDGKQFQLMIYPGLNHSLQGPKAAYHLYKMMTRFILRNL